MVIELTDLMQIMASSASEVGQTFRQPDDDWCPVVHMVDKNNNVTVVALADGLDDESLAVLAVAAKSMNSDIETVALVASAWTAECDSQEEAENARASEHLNRVEALILYGVSLDNPGQMWIANIQRHDERPPTLGPWDKKEYSHSGGRIPDALEALLIKKES